MASLGIAEWRGMWTNVVVGNVKEVERKVADTGNSKVGGAIWEMAVAYRDQRRVSPKFTVSMNKIQPPNKTPIQSSFVYVPPASAPSHIDNCLIEPPGHIGRSLTAL